MPQPLRALSDELDAGNTQPDFLEFDVPDTTTPMPMESMFPVQDSNHLTLLRDWPHAVLALEMGREPRLLFWNSQAEHLLGYEALDLVGNPLGLTLLCPDQDYRTRKLSELQQLGAGGVDLEWTLTCRDGQKLRLAWSLLPMLQTQGVSRVFWLVGVDVSRRALTEQALRGRDRLLRSLFRHLPDMVYLKDGRGAWLMANPAALAVVGLTEAQAIGHTNLELADRGSPMAAALRLSALNEEATWQTGRASHLQEVGDDAQGMPRSFDVVRVPSFARDGGRLHMLVIRRDITEQRTAATKLELAGRVLDQGSDGIVICDADRQVMMVNQAFSDISGFAADEMVGRPYKLLADGQHDDAFLASIWSAVHEHGRWSGEVWGRRKTGEV